MARVKHSPCNRRWADRKFFVLKILTLPSSPPPSRLNNKFDGVKQGFFGSMKKIPFSKIWKEGYNIPSDDEWIYLPKDPPSIFSCGARISCSVRAVELCARSDIPSDCPISKQTGEKSNLYSTSSRFTSFVRQFDKILYRR